MSGVFRIGFAKIFTGVKNPIHKRLPEFIFFRQISGKALRVTKPNKPAPYPYKTKKYGLLQSFFDKTTARFDENTKIIVVDGPIAAGKSEFAKELAKDLDMLYMPEANYDMFYINDYGFDLRTLNNQIPESCRTFDVKDFCLDPNNRLTATFQLNMYMIRYSQYIDALAHMLSTGQGIVLDRSVYSDFVFLEAMYRQGYISSGARSFYYDIKNNTITELLKPHLVIYLDVPVDCVQEKIKKRCIPYEIQSKVFTEEYLSTMERYYKQHYLKEISIHSELLIYDWSSGGDVEVVVEDIERIDFDSYDKHDKKLANWRLLTEEDWASLRNQYADNKQTLMCYLNIPRFDVPELIIEAEDYKAACDVWLSAPGEKFEVGYNTDQGDSGLLFKTGYPHRETLPLRERTIEA